MKTKMQRQILYNGSLYTGLFTALVALFIMLLIAGYTRMWIQVGIAIVVYVSGVILQFFNLRSEYLRIRWEYNNDEANRFNRRAKYFGAGNSLVMLAAMLIFAFIRHQL